jgi:hypothetical protein
MARAKKVNGKKKGNKFELDIAHSIADTIAEPYGTKVRRTPGSGSLLCRADLWIHQSARYKFPWFLELKKRENIRLEHLFKPKNYIVGWYKDSKEKLQIDPEYDPMTTPTALLFAKNNMMPFILMSGKDFVDMELPSRYKGLRITFTDEEEHYIVLEWQKFLQLHTVTLDK